VKPRGKDGFTDKPEGLAQYLWKGEIPSSCILGLRVSMQTVENRKRFLNWIISHLDLFWIPDRSRGQVLDFEFWI